MNLENFTVLHRDDDDNEKRSADRIATVLVYLEAPEAIQVKAARHSLRINHGGVVFENKQGARCSAVL
jgi:hypothetical protein